MNAPARRYLSLVNCILRNFPNRDELLFLKVLAFPNDSRIGEESTTFCSRLVTPPTDRCVKNLLKEGGGDAVSRPRGDRGRGASDGQPTQEQPWVELLAATGCQLERLAVVLFSPPQHRAYRRTCVQFASSILPPIPFRYFLFVSNHCRKPLNSLIMHPPANYVAS